MRPKSCHRYPSDVYSCYESLNVKFCLTHEFFTFTDNSGFITLALPSFDRGRSKLIKGVDAR